MWPKLKRFFRTYVLPFKWRFGGVLILHVVAVAFLLLPPLIIRRILDVSIPDKNVHELWPLAGAFLGLYALWAVASGIKEYVGHEVAQRVTVNLRNDLYSHFQKLSLSFHDNKKTGELLARLIDDINVVQEFTYHGPETIIEALAFILGSAAFLVMLNWRLALLALAFMPFLALYAKIMGGRLYREFREVREQIASLSDVFEENLTGIHVIKAFVGEDRGAEAVSRHNEGHYRSRMRVIRWVALLFPGAMVINNAALAVVLLTGGFFAIRGAMAVGTLVAFILYLQRFLQPIMRLMMLAESGGQFVAGIERSFEYLDIVPDIQDRPRATTLDHCRGEVRFENVFFRYDRDVVLDDVSLVARPGQMVALVGPSGAGKTTIIRLIPRFYEPFRGRVLVDGVDVHDVQQRALREHIGMVMQDDFLFSGSVAENIAYGRPGATRDEVVRAAELANAAPFIAELPDGYETEIGKRGIKLSEGQRQRLSIARALLRNPQILLLDEATSSVDTETEKLIQQAIERLRTGRTTFAIAHRLSTILQADQILFIEKGRILERGTHTDLLAADGRYAQFYRIQFEARLAV